MWGHYNMTRLDGSKQSINDLLWAINLREEGSTQAVGHLKLAMTMHRIVKGSKIIIYNFL